MARLEARAGTPFLYFCHESPCGSAGKSVNGSYWFAIRSEKSGLQNQVKKFTRKIRRDSRRPQQIEQKRNI
jgi:hypothetical protein